MSQDKISMTQCIFLKGKKGLCIWSQMICECIDNEMLMTGLGWGARVHVLLYILIRRSACNENRVVCYGRPLLTTSESFVVPATSYSHWLFLGSSWLLACASHLTVSLSVHSWVSGSSGCPAGLSNQLCIGVANLNMADISVRLFPLLCFTCPVPGPYSLGQSPEQGICV